MKRLGAGLVCATLLATGARLGADVLEVSPFAEFTTVNLYHLHDQLQEWEDFQNAPSVLNAPAGGLDVGVELMTKALTPALLAPLALGLRFDDVDNRMTEAGGVRPEALPVDASLTGTEQNTYASSLVDALLGWRWSDPMGKGFSQSLGIFAGLGYANLGYGYAENVVTTVEGNAPVASSYSGSADWDGLGFVAVVDMRFSYTLPILPALSFNADLGGRYASFGQLSNASYAEYVRNTPSGEDFSGLIAGVGASYGFL